MRTRSKVEISGEKIRPGRDTELKLKITARVIVFKEEKLMFKKHNWNLIL